MTTIGLFDGARHVGSVALPPGQDMPEAVIRGADVFLYFNGERLSAGEPRLELAPGESARFLKLRGVLRA